MGMNVVDHYLDSNKKAQPGTSLGTLLSGEDQTNNVMVVEEGQFEMIYVAASSDTTLGATGAAGDLLHKVIMVTDGTATASQVTVSQDGGTTDRVLQHDGAANQVTEVTFDAACTGAGWNITTEANVAVFAIGRFT